ncbi:hypothetical protein JWG45_17235 [Leptospira sp. 201903070]|uniref:Uncharacterized protein n=1 Tax=Leptospira ainlahdjerensis TaxID=2810033 RepID=A0ABS2UES6_9LEPT|nr:hypothetical protein [Leptospira ainlahdjerensis]MBM9578892.1 hypothetical protein [Leptospira ainlahdjerensis]
MGIIEDFRTNRFTFPGIPGVSVFEIEKEIWEIKLTLADNLNVYDSFVLPSKDAIIAAKSFWDSKKTNGDLFKLVQNSIVNLEKKYGK